jgi:hypothetical protein
VTFRDLQKLVQSQSDPEQSKLLRDKPFWIWDQSKHKQEDIKTIGDCCFNHVIGLPRKDNQEKPLFEYERVFYDSLLIPDFYNPLQHTFKLKHCGLRRQLVLVSQSSFSGLWHGFPISLFHNFKAAQKGYCSGITLSSAI